LVFQQVTAMKMYEWTGRVFLKATLAASLAMLGAAALRSDQAPAERAAPSYPQVVMADKPVAYWRLGEKVGATVAKDEMGKHHGQYHGRPTFGERSPIKSDPATAVALDGKSYVEVPDSPDFSQPTTGSGKAGLTVEVWMRPDKLDFFGGQEEHEYTHWLGKGENRKDRPKHNEWALRFYPKPSTAGRPNRLSAYIFNPDGGKGAGAAFQPGGKNPPVKQGEWIHVVACYDLGDQNSPGMPGVSFFRNGDLAEGPKTHTGPRNTNGALYNGEYHITPKKGPSPLRLGTVDLQSFFVGGLCEVAIYPRVLSGEQIRHHYQAGIGK
jgi:hypothetical protein